MTNPLLLDGLGNIAAGARLAFFLPAERGAFRLGPHQVASLLLFAILFEVIVGFVLTEPRREFYLYGLTDRALYYLVILFGAYLVSTLVRRVDTMSHLAVVTLSTYPLVVIATTAGDSWVAAAETDDAEHRLWLLGVALVMWVGTIVFRAVRLLYSVPVGRALLLAVVFLAINLPPRSIFPPQPLWFSRSDEVEPEQVSLPINVEDAYYAQSRLLGAMTGDLAPGRPGVTDLYFLGFGSYAEADVFMKEVFYVKELFDRRFDTPRSIARARQQSCYRRRCTARNDAQSDPRPGTNRGADEFGRRHPVLVHDLARLARSSPDGRVLAAEPQ